MRRVTLNLAKPWLISVIAFGLIIYFTLPAITRLRDEYRLVTKLDGAGGRPSPENIRDQVSEVRRMSEKYGSPLLKWILSTRLVILHWYFPEESGQEIHEAIALGREVYSPEDLELEQPTYFLAWSYFAAGLHAEFDEFLSEGLVRAPSLRSELLSLAISSRICSDDLPGALEVAVEDAKNRPQAHYLAPLSASAHLALGSYDQAWQALDRRGQLSPADTSMTYAAAGTELSRKNYGEALLLMLEAIGNREVDPEQAQDLLPAAIGRLGVASQEVAFLAKRSSMSGRLRRSADGATALALAQLFALTLDQQWIELLIARSEASPTDFAVQYALSSALLDAEDAQKIPQARAGRDWHGLSSAPSVADAVSRSSALAERPMQVQAAAILRARLAVHSGDPQSDMSVSQGIAALRAALAASQSKEAGQILPVPPYELFLLDWHVRDWRTKSPAFDEETHRAIEDYLEGRRKAFEDAMSAPLGKPKPLPKEMTVPESAPVQEILSRMLNGRLLALAWNSE